MRQLRINMQGNSQRPVAIQTLLGVNHPHVALELTGLVRQHLTSSIDPAPHHAISPTTEKGKECTRANPIRSCTKILGTLDCVALGSAAQRLRSLARSRFTPSAVKAQMEQPTTQALSSQVEKIIVGQIHASSAGISVRSTQESVKISVPSIRDREHCQDIIGALAEVFAKAPRRVRWEVDLASLRFIPASIVSTLVSYSSQLENQGVKLEATVSPECYYTRFVSKDLRKRLGLRVAPNHGISNQAEPIHLTNFN